MPEAVDDEPLDQLRRSLAAVDALIRHIRRDQWSSATPCTDWDVGRVVDHLVGMNQVFAAMLAGDPPPRRGEDLPVEELPQAFRDSGAALLDAFAQPGALHRSHTSALGSATGAERLQIRLYDLLAHGWDIAIATDQPAVLPEDAAEDSLAFVRGQLRDDARPGRFGPPQQAAAGASAVEQLVAFLGRAVPPVGATDD